MVLRTAGIFFLFLYLLLCSADPVIDVDVSSSQTSFQFVAGRDGEGVQYRCVVNGSPVGLTWWFGGTDKGNPLNAYQFYGEYRALTDYTVECHSSSGRVGNMTLTLKDAVRFNVTYSGTVRSFNRDGGKEQNVFIPLNTQNIVFTCEISNGILFTPIGIRIGTNPSITLTELNETSGVGIYQCQRLISAPFLVLELVVRIGEPPTSIPTPTIPVTTPMTTNTTITTTNTTAATTTSITIPTNTTTATSTNTPTTNTTTNTATNSTPITTTTVMETTVTTPTTIAIVPTSTSSTSNPATETTVTPSATTTTTTTPTTTATTESIVTGSSISATSVPISSNTTSNTTLTPNMMAGTPTIVIGFVIVGMIFLILLLAGGALGVCLWRHYSGFKNKNYLKQTNDSERNGSTMRDMVQSPKQFLSMSGTYYEPLATGFTEDTTHSHPIPLNTFKTHLDKLWDSDCMLLNAEYNALGLSELRHPTEAAREHISNGKNRYKNIYPYDKSRVHLQLFMNTTDYVNASYIPGVAVQELFIACQAPKKETMLEFWEMLWQKKVSNIVMLTRIMEGGKKKCEPYFPDRVGETIAVGDIYITLLQISSDFDQTTRMLEVKTGRDVTTELRIRHFHFLGWPDHEAPRFPHGLISFIKKVKREMVSDENPICCHCSAGVGRSGAFIALFNLIEEIRAFRPISIFRIVNEMREHRPHMVQTFTQYKFIYLSCLELIYGDTAVPAASYTHYYKTCTEGGPAVLQRQLEEIDYFCEKSFDRSQSEALNPRYVTLNPDPSVLPFDDYRPSLSMGDWGVGEYINASYVDAFQGYQDLIATQHSNAYSTRGTIQLIFQTECPLLVVLASKQEYAEMGYEHGRIVYWPEPNTQHEFDGFILKNLSMVQREIMEYTLVDTSEEKQHRFNIIISLHWGPEGDVLDKESVIGIVNEMISVKANFPTKPIIVQCRDGAGKTGVLISLYNAITQATQEQRVDVFQTVKYLRYCRPKLVHNLAQYQSLHAVLHLHLSPNTYENLSSNS